jgi:GAF domain-containing protein
MMSDHGVQPTVRAPRNTRSSRLAETFVSLADTLVDDYDVVELLHRLTERCVELLDITAAGLLLMDQDGALHSIAWSSEESHFLELSQLQNDEGPCLECVSTGKPVFEPDLAASRGRWPAFRQAAIGVGYRSVCALPMRLRSETIGGLNLFNSDQPPLDDEDQRIGQALADVATIGILQQRVIHRSSLVAEQLQTALNTRIVIEQAKGVLAEHGGIDMGAAFSALRRFGRDSNQKLSVVAGALASGTLPPARVLGTPDRD